MGVYFNQSLRLGCMFSVCVTKNIFYVLPVCSSLFKKKKAVEDKEEVAVKKQTNSKFTSSKWKKTVHYPRRN